MKRLIFATALLAAAALLLGSGCRKEDDDCFDEGNPRCSNYDPCWGKQQVSAAFEMAERISHFDSVWYIPTDTMLVGNQLRLRAFQPADSLRWHIDSDPRVWDEEELRIWIRFEAVLEVTLILWRQPDTLCFPDDDGVDTLRRRLVVVPPQEAAVIGRYRGATDARPDEPYEMEIFWRESNPLATYPTMRITGVHPGCNNTLTYNVLRSIGPGYLVYAFWEDSAQTTTGCMAPQGIARLSASRQEITVRFRMRNPDKITEFLPETTFRGVRL
jgi:hypothetical protein